MLTLFLRLGDSALILFARADVETINFELALADVAQIEKRLERLVKGAIPPRVAV